MSSDFFGFNTTQIKTLQHLGLGGDNPNDAIVTLAEQVANLNAWATAVATALNAEDTLPLDPQLPTNPQA